ncbi:ParB/RepB/Spo0J family partition protein [Labrys neptuniae]|uniref:ParB N-terminal domain-containing protein n=1 Tax=Labrys neptuniae TaxID=376174 RepID=A0ABV3PHP4_9HYPH
MPETVVQKIPLSLIDASDRLRPIDESWALAISESMAERGLLEPIVVRTDGASYILTAGGHRYRAAELLGWETIDAIVREMSPNEARLAEIDENLMRRELDPLDKAVFLAERKEIYLELHPETGHGKKKGKSNQHVRKDAESASFLPFADEVAEKVGMSKRNVALYCQIAAGLSSEIVALIRNTPLASNLGMLKTFSAYPAEQQLAAASRFATGEVKTLAGANGRTERTDWEKTLQQWTDTWSNRMPPDIRRRFLAFVGVTPAEVEQIVNPRGAKAKAA